MNKNNTKLANILSGLTPSSDDITVNYSFKPWNEDFITMSWKSPSDKKENLIRLFISPKNPNNIIQMEDNH